MVRPFAPAYNQTFKNVIAPAGTITNDFGPADASGRSFRVFNAGANQLEFAFCPDNTVVAADKGVQLKAGDSIIIWADSNQRWFSARSVAGSTVYVTPGQGSV